MNWAYWINGAGQHMTRWHCTKEDLLCCVAQITVTTAMAALYIVYAVQNHAALKNISQSHFRTHLVSARNVFVVCGGIHVLNCIVGWVAPMNWIVVYASVFNCIQSWWLVSSRQQTLAIEAYTQGNLAIQNVENALELIAKAENDAEVAGIKDTLQEFKDALRRKNM